MKHIISTLCRILIVSSVLAGLTAVMLFNGDTIGFKRAVAILFICYIFFFGNLVILRKLDEKFRNGGNLF